MIALLNGDYVPDPILSTLILETGTIIIPIYQMKRLRHRVGKSIAQGLIADEWLYDFGSHILLPVWCTDFPLLYLQTKSRFPENARQKSERQPLTESSVQALW